MPDTTQMLREAKAVVFEQTLRPNGFIAGAHLFSRHGEGQLHGIHIQPSRGGDGYFVNVAFHYDFLPPLLQMAVGRDVPTERFDLLDFMLSTRLKALTCADRPSERKLTQRTAEQVEQQLRDDMRDALEGLGPLTGAWRDPNVFLDLLPPDLLEDDMRRRLARAKPPLPFDVVLGAWSPPDFFRVGYSLCVIAMRAGRLREAAAYLAIAESRSQGANAPEMAALRKAVGAAQT